MNKFIVALLAALAAVVLAGCGSVGASVPPSKPGDGGNFLPTYLDTLRGTAPPDNACHPQTLHDLLIPCDNDAAASADLADVIRPDPQAFINALIRDGMNPQSPDKAIALGYRICTAMRSGISQDAVIEWLVKPPDPVPRNQATQFVADSRSYLCPDSPTDGSWTI